MSVAISRIANHPYLIAVLCSGLFSCLQSEKIVPQEDEDVTVPHFSSITEVPEPIVEHVSGPSGTAAKPKILIVSHYTLEAPYLEYTRKNHKQYAAKHGYDYWFRNGNIDFGRFRDLSNPSRVHNLGLYWQKIAAVKQALALMDGNKRKYDIVMWIDADAFFMHDNKSLEQHLQDIGVNDLLPKSGNLFFLVAGDPSDMINSGVFFVKNNEKGRELFEHVELAFSQYKDFPWPEQTAIGDTIYQYAKFLPEGVTVEPFDKNPALERMRDPSRLLPGVKVLPQRDINAWYASAKNAAAIAWRSGDFICHFAGGGGDKMRLMTKLFDCIDLHGGVTAGCEFDAL